MRNLLLRLFLLISICTSLVGSLRSQTHIHANTSSDMIDGAAHPERVSDSTAYRMYFLTVSELANPTSEAKARQLAHLSKVHLEGADLNFLISTLEMFKQQYNALVDQYNREATVIDLAGGTPNIESFLIQRDALVQSTREALKQTLSTDGMTRLHTHIQDEKRKMKIAATEAQ